MLLIVANFLPSTAHASMLSDFLATVTHADSAEADTVSGSDNVQTMSILTPAMNINPTPVTGGGSATIVDSSALMPQEGPSGTMADIEKPKNGTISVYVVQPGDSLSGIAKHTGVTVNTILWANNLTNKSVISPGDQLIILPVTGYPYTLKKGDTLASIAKRFGGEPTDIGSYNGIDDATLTPGVQIIIPNVEAGAGSGIASTGDTSKATLPSAHATHKSTTRVLLGVPASGSIIPMANNPAEPAHNVGHAGTPAEIAYYVSPISGHYYQTQGIHGYNAVDLADPVGTPIVAAADGEVIVAREGGWNGGYGSYVVLTHDNGSQTLYGHMSKVIAYNGEQVVQGQIIGYVGMTGETTGPHVHFEIRNGIRNPF